MLSDKEILLQAKRRYEEAENHWGDFHQKSTELLEFISGEQWTYQARQSYENAGFAAMTSNRLPTYLRQITNELIKNTPQIQIDPRSDGDEEKAEVLNDLIRAIQENSDAKVAYCKGAELAASIGIGYFRISTKFKDNKSMDKEIIIEKIDDPNLVMLDPHHTGLCGEDSEFGFITTVLSHAEYNQKYSKTKLGRRLRGAETKEDLLEAMKDVSWSPSGRKWTQEDQVLILEYYFKDYLNKTLYQIFDKDTGATFTAYELDKAQMDSGVHVILQQRDVQVPVVRWCKLNDLEVLEQTEWPGEYIPIVAVKADEYWIEGKRKLLGAVEPAVEAQVELNYAKSWRGQLLQMAPKAPYIGTAQQFKNFEQQWANINVSNQAFLPYNKEEGAPPPTRDTSEIPIQAATVLVTQAQDDMRAIFGTFDPDNTKGAVESGKARLIRENQSFNSNYHFYENLSRSIAHAGCIIVQAIPVVYDTARDVQVLAQDGKKKTVSINTPNEAGVVEYDMTEGEYTVSIETGPGFGTKRQEMADAVMDLIGVYPQAAPAIADIAVRQMDWNGADKIADSLEAMVPPQVLQARKVDPKNAAAMVPGLQAQLQAAHQQIQVLGQQHQQMAQKLEDKSTEVQIELMKSKDDQHKVDTDKEIKMAQLKLQEQRTELEFLVKERELKIAELQLELEKAKLAVQGTKVMSDMVDSHHNHTIEHLDRISGGPTTGEDSTGMSSSDLA